MSWILGLLLVLIGLYGYYFVWMNTTIHPPEVLPNKMLLFMLCYKVPLIGTVGFKAFLWEIVVYPGLILGAIAALWIWSGSRKSQHSFRERLQEREKELGELRAQLKDVQTSFQNYVSEHEQRVQEFTLKALSAVREAVSVSSVPPLASGVSEITVEELPLAETRHLPAGEEPTEQTKEESAPRDNES